MRVALINPPPAEGRRFIREGRCMQSVASWAALWPPLTLAQLAALARRDGHDVLLTDGNVEPDPTLKAVTETTRRFAPDVIVISTGFPSLDGDHALALALRQACPGVPITGLGQFFTLTRTEGFADTPAFDLALIGEPELPFLNLLGWLAAGRPESPPAGIMSRDDSGKPVDAIPCSQMEQLDELPFPAVDYLKREAYRLPHNGQPFMLVNVARGCSAPCIFCIAPAYHGRRLRRHSLEYVMAELAYFDSSFGLKHFLFWEEVFAHDRPFAEELCAAMIARGSPWSWAATTRADKVDKSLLTLMKRAGCFLLGLGIESGNQQILDTARKGETLEDTRRAVALCREVGIRSMGHFIFGLPGETPETARETLRFALSLGLDYLQCYAAVPYPGTPLGQLARERGWIRAERWSQYDFGGPSIMDIGTISPVEVDAFRRRLFRRFYFSPRFLARQAQELLWNPRQLAQAAGFLRWI
ncbi:MAG TPA: radical SAM protein [Candidatus Hydrogenedentes bacterium]|nr:radical SAM protein [Candidatus Hydrogenedentota bacterium]